MFRCQDLALNVIFQTEQRRRTATDCKSRPGRHRRHDTLEPVSVDRQLSRDDWTPGVDFGLQRVSDSVDDDFSFRRVHRACRLHSLTEPFDKKASVGVKHDFHDCRIVQRFAKISPKCFS